MAKGHGKTHGKRHTKPHVIKDFTIKDARKLFVIRSFANIIELKATQIVAGANDKQDHYDDAVKAIKALIARLDELNKRDRESLTDECWDEYELCDDRTCRLWCS